MTNKNYFIVCVFDLKDGYIFKNFFGFHCLKGRPIITITNDKIISSNRTVDEQLYGGGFLHGDEINLTWDELIPQDIRQFNLQVEGDRLQTTLGKIKKKDPAKIIIAQLRDISAPCNFNGPDSLDDFAIFLSFGVGGEGREGMKSVPAVRAENQPILIKYPLVKESNLIVINVKDFRSMVDSFSKCKKETIIMRFHVNYQNINGREVKGKPGFEITTEPNPSSNIPPIVEKFGNIPDDDNFQSSFMPLDNLRIDESAIMYSNQPSIEIVKPRKPNEFILNSDKITHFCKLSSMHNEGNIRIRYQEGYHLQIAYRCGAFGENEICLF